MIRLGTRRSALATAQATWVADRLRALGNDVELVPIVTTGDVKKAPLEQIGADVALMQELMRRASRVVLGEHELRTDAKIIRYPDRYTDRRGDAVWANVLALLAEYQQARDQPAALPQEGRR